jgi:CubicO group peptidase (beta-lactamase class C family)
MRVCLEFFLAWRAVSGFGVCEDQQRLFDESEPIKKPPEGGKANNQNPLDDDFRSHVDDLMKRRHVPGVSIGVVNGREIFTAGYGYSRSDTKEAANADTLYYLASITKNLVSATLLHVIDSTTNTSNPVTLDSKVHTLIPDEFVLSDDYATLHASIKDVLSHQLGYPGHDLSYGGDNFTVADTVRLLRHLPMNKELREKYQYFNIGFLIAQHIVQSMTGQWIGDVQKAAIFEPLGMNASTVNLGEALGFKDNTLAYGYAWDPITESLIKQEWWDGLLVGAGGLITSVNDYTKYLRAMIHQELSMSKELQTALITPLSVADPVFDAEYISHYNYAMGWGVMYYRGHRVITRESACSNSGCRSITLMHFVRRRGRAGLHLGDGLSPGPKMGRHHLQQRGLLWCWAQLRRLLPTSGQVPGHRRRRREQVRRHRTLGQKDPDRSRYVSEQSRNALPWRCRPASTPAHPSWGI